MNFPELKAVIFRLIALLSEQASAKTAEYRIIERAVEFINGRYAENLPVKSYADICNMSESYFRKKFAAYMGMSPIDYRNRCRFDKAKELYRYGRGSQEIAEQVGFCDSGYMLKLYKRKTGRALKDDLKLI